MAKLILLDEIHISVHAPPNFPATHAILRTLKSKSFHSQLRAAIAGVFRRHTPLKDVKITLSR